MDIMLVSIMMQAEVKSALDKRSGSTAVSAFALPNLSPSGRCKHWLVAFWGLGRFFFFCLFLWLALEKDIFYLSYTADNGTGKLAWWTAKTRLVTWQCSAGKEVEPVSNISLFETMVIYQEKLLGSVDQGRKWGPSFGNPWGRLLPTSYVALMVTLPAATS